VNELAGSTCGRIVAFRANQVLSKRGIENKAVTRSLPQAMTRLPSSIVFSLAIPYTEVMWSAMCGVLHLARARLLREHCTRVLCPVFLPGGEI